MNSTSAWHWLILLVAIALPVFFILKPASRGSKRFGAASRPHSFLQAIDAYFINYFNFSGRASLSEFWYAVLFIVMSFALLRTISLPNDMYSWWTTGTFLPSLSLTVRRLHDLDRSSWHILLAFLFLIGSVALIVWFSVPRKTHLPPAARQTLIALTSTALKSYHNL